MLQPMRTDRHRFAAVTVTTLVLLLAWDASGLDRALAHLIAGPRGFPLRDHWLLAGVLHDAARRVSWLIVLALCAAVVWPIGPWVSLPFARRVQVPATALLSTGVVVTLKGFSGTSCPWDLSDFGGVAHYLSHWQGWTVPDGGGGRCFPAGHAASGFAFVGGYFALRNHVPRLARAWLVVALLVGLLLGAVQQVRGAHFMSHTLWTAWLCWVVAWLSDIWFSREAKAPAALASP
jgi:membrane-associated PAP2 superfamily phosphatase